MAIFNSTQPAAKKDIARIYTIVRKRELGIRTAPEPKTDKKAAKKK